MTTPVPRDVKGKGRATETTPLLSDGAPSSHTAPLTPIDEEGQQPTPQPQFQRHSLRRALVNVFLCSLTAVVLLFVLAVLLVYSYAQRVRGVHPDQLAKAIIWQGPSSLDVLEMKEGGHVVAEIKGLIGVDTNAILGFKREDDDEDGLFTSLWKDIGRWGVGFVREVSVDLGEVVTYDVNRENPLAWASVEPFTVRLTSNPGRPWDASWLKPVKFRVTAYPTEDTDLLQRLAQEAWENGVVNLHIEVDSVRVQGGNLKGDGGWRRMIKEKQTNLNLDFHYTIPDMPGIPEPRPPLVKMLQLISYSLLQEDGHLALYALASIPSPLDHFKFSLPRIPYEVALLAPPLQPVLISTGSVAPVFTPPNISLPITGQIVPLPSAESSLVLSSFLSQFLRAIPPPIALHCPLLPKLTIETTFPVPDPLPRVLRNVTIKHMSVSVAPGGGMHASGVVWATIALPPGLHVPINATHVWPDVLVYDGPIEDPEEDDDELFMDYDSPIHLPDVEIPHPHIPKVPKVPKPHLPDVPVPRIPYPWDHDFPFPPTPKLPDHSHPSHRRDDPPPLPSPLPDRAFARIRPTDWVVATTMEPCDGDAHRVITSSLDGEHYVLVNGRKKKDDPCQDLGEDVGWSAVVTAVVEKVPLQVLPGRDKQFRSFMSKVVLSKDGALAGIKGVAGVKAKVDGLLNVGAGDEESEQSLELHDLPFEGTVLVGKRSL